MAIASSVAAPSAAGRSSTSTCSWRPHWWWCANSFNGRAAAIAGRPARRRAASSRAYCRALLVLQAGKDGPAEQVDGARVVGAQLGQDHLLDALLGRGFEQRAEALGDFLGPTGQEAGVD